VSYEVNALRGLLTGTAARLPLDLVVLAGAAVVAIAAAAALLGRACPLTRDSILVETVGQDPPSAPPDRCHP